MKSLAAGLPQPPMAVEGWSMEDRYQMLFVFFARFVTDIVQDPTGATPRVVLGGVELVLCMVTLERSGTGRLSP